MGGDDKKLEEAAEGMDEALDEGAVDRSLAVQGEREEGGATGKDEEE